MQSMKIDISRLKTRVIWGFNPVQRVVKNKKIYSRRQSKASARKEFDCL